MIEVDKNISLPPSSRSGSGSKYPFADMEVGDSFEVPQGKRTSVYQSSVQWTSKHNPGWKFSVRLDQNKVLRCWRIA